MIKKLTKINNIPAIIWNEKSEKVFIFIHGQGGSKDDAKIIAEKVSNYGYQVLSIDLPGYGDRENEIEDFVPWFVKNELKALEAHVKKHWKQISLCSVSIGSYFSMISFNKDIFEQVLFISPVVDMSQIIYSMMDVAQVSIEKLQKDKIVETSFGYTLSWDYLDYVIKNQITDWKKSTYIIFGEKDTLVNINDINKFVLKYDSILTIIKDGEHWLHTKEHLSLIEEWVDNILVNK